MTMARLRTVKEALQLIKQKDGETAVTCNFIRQLCRKGIIHSFTIGKKVLLNYDELLAYLHISDSDE